MLFVVLSPSLQKQKPEKKKPELKNKKAGNILNGCWLKIGKHAPICIGVTRNGCTPMQIGVRGTLSADQNDRLFCCIHSATNTPVLTQAALHNVVNSPPLNLSNSLLLKYQLELRKYPGKRNFATVKSRQPNFYNF